MDDSPRYIEMCEKAFGDIGYIPPQGHFWNVVIIKPPPYKFPYTIAYDKTIKSIESGCDPGRKVTGQLYRQDQLQETITDKGYFGFSLIESFYHFANEWHRGSKAQFNSMEQLWLGFVMKEKYQKVWNGKDWVKK